MCVIHSTMRALSRLLVVAACLLVVCHFPSVLAQGRDPAVPPPSNAWPSLKLHVTMKRKRSTLHGVSSYTIDATPVVSRNGTRVMFNTRATFAQGDARVTYALWHGAAYEITTDARGRERVRCMSPHLLPWNAFVPALNDATRIPRASIGTKPIECPRGHLFTTRVVGTKYVLCVSDTGFTAISSDVDVVVAYVPERIKMHKPARAQACDPVTKPIELTPLARALVTGRELPPSTSRLLSAAFEAETMVDGLATTECQCPSQPRPCIFFHGLGNANEFDDLQNTPKLTERERIGDMHGHAPCCSKIKYSILNTQDRGWNDETLQEKYCDHMLRMSETSDADDKIVRDTIVVTHSMAGLAMAGALANKKCSFASSTSWVANSSPMTGSMGCDYLEDICSTNIINKAAAMVGRCPISISRKSTIYQTGKYSNGTMYEAYKAAQEAYRDNVAAAICSDTYVGLFSKYQAPAIIGGTILPHKSSENDGLTFEAYLQR
ncbi:hypothetical protein PsorP6_017052 [Peronosclerospora sorghi]|uniref:Uncharacterized protein n=1 Tax=Peronosclerospora sorghi TaxID=230839 RepID=A0ACC0WDZ5_9STRA|nr:hypothetical protein PsorP6_017052 [Peronosclerospora sorghi]